MRLMTKLRSAARKYWYLVLLLVIAILIYRTISFNRRMNAGVPHKNSAINQPIEQTDRTKWLAHGRFGIMVHYLISPAGETPEKRTAEFNRIVNSFNLEAFIKQFDKIGADWLIFTIGQNTGYYCSPNKFLDTALPGHTSQRNLPLEIARELKARHKRFIAYLPVEVNAQSDEMKKAFGWQGADPKHSLFQTNCQRFIREYSLALGKLVDGWWFDGAPRYLSGGLPIVPRPILPKVPIIGCPFRENLQGEPRNGVERGSEAERGCYDSLYPDRCFDFSGFIDAVRAGNPDSICAFNDGSFAIGRLAPLTKLEDYISGETFELMNGDICLSRCIGRQYMPTERFIDGVQWHCLLPVDSTFTGSGDNHYRDEELINLIQRINKVQGAITFNLPLNSEGTIAESTVEQLQRISKALNNDKSK